MKLYALETEPITYRYAGGPVVLDAVRFRAEPGTLTVLIGPNGTGKSTLLKILAGTLQLTGLRMTLTPRVAEEQATAEVGVEPGIPPSTAPGQEPIALHHLPPRERACYLAYLPQNVIAPDDLRVEEVVALGRFPHQRWWSMAGPSEHEIVRAALAEVDATALAGRRFVELSGGEQQSVLLASVLAQQSPVLLLDEPGKALDIHHQAVLFGRLRAMAEQGRTVVAITHDLNIAARFAGRVVLMQGGKIVADGTPANVLTPVLLQAAYGPEVRVVPDPDSGVPIVIPSGAPTPDAAGSAGSYSAAATASAASAGSAVHGR